MKIAQRVLLLGALLGAACSDPFEAEQVRAYRSVATGGDHSCAVATDSIAYCWGNNADGQLGNDGTTNVDVPVRVKTDARFSTVTAGLAHTCALATGGVAYCWGWNAFFQLGTSSSTDSRVPQPVATNLRFLSLSAGGYHTCGLGTDRVVYCWGYNRYGQLGNNTVQSSATPQRFNVTVPVLSMSAGGFHTCALTVTARDIWCAGLNDYGQLGSGIANLSSAQPLRANSALRFVSLDAGKTHTCAVNDAARAFCWGSAEFGELGDRGAFKPGLPGPSVPTAVALLTAVTAVSAGSSATCASDVSIGTACWGRGIYGQLGNGDLKDYAVRQPVVLKPANPLRFSDLATGGNTHACGISSGSVFCWGSGPSGQLGAGPNSFSTIPQRIREK